MTAPSYPTTFGTTAEADHTPEIFPSSPAPRVAIPLDPVMPEPSHNRTHHRIARFAPVISSHPKNSSNRAAPSPIETRNQLIKRFCILHRGILPNRPDVVTQSL